jgi:23S rRNA (cytidine1920-2'-O)/16S rRNA (cytidine1409-2'-O)-methyltransferase
MVARKLVESRQRGQALILAGRVQVNDQLADKPGRSVSKNDVIVLKGDDLPYVSRGGLKLEKALTAFEIDAAGKTCLDVGASTGGFTDCLLQHGAKHVYAVDVGYGQLAWKLRQDPRVTVIERTNIRYMPCALIQHPLDLIAIDVAFISLKTVVPALVRFIHGHTDIVALVKPQFEVGKGRIGKGGVVRDAALHDQVIADLASFFCAKGFAVKPAIESPLRGPKGNREFLVFLQPEPKNR